MPSSLSRLCHAIKPMLGGILVAAFLFSLSGCGDDNPLIELREIGADYKRTKARTIELVRLPKTAGDEAVALVAQIPKPEEIKELNLAGTQITDEGLKPLEKLTGLEILDISDTGITNEGLKYLEPLQKLKSLKIGNTKVTYKEADPEADPPTTDEGLADLIPKLSSLTALDVAGEPEPKKPDDRTWQSALNFGIDLAGGTNLVYQVDKQKIEEKRQELIARGEANTEEGSVTSSVMDQMVGAVSRRLNPSGTEEITVRKVGSDRIEVIIPKASPEVVARKKRQMTRLGSLEFALLANRTDHQALRGEMPADGSDLYYTGEDGKPTTLKASWREVGVDSKGLPKEVGEHERVYKENGKFLVYFGKDNARIRGDLLDRAFETKDDTGRLAVGFLFSVKGGNRFASLTSQNRPGTDFKRRLAILLDDKIHSAPTINSTISRQGQISGTFTHEEVQELIGVLNAGALQVPIKEQPISEQTISPLLGHEVQESGINAIVIAASVVLVFMLIYYMFAGLVADICLILNIILVMGAMALIDATFTLPGLAGIVLTIGMAVDANVLIFERIREELNRGSSMRMAIQNGFGRAFSAIIDANLTTLITAVVLYTIGTDQVRGFAVTLFIGIVMSMFTALFFGRMVFEIGERKQWITKLKMLRVVSDNTAWKFIGKAKIAAIVSIVVIVCGMSAFFVRGGDNFDIDFSGGTMLTFELKAEDEIADVRTALQGQFEDNFTLEKMTRKDLKSSSDDMGQLFRIRTKEADQEKVKANVTKAMSAKLLTVAMSSSDISSEGEPSADPTTPAKVEHTATVTFEPGLTQDRMRENFINALSEQTTGDKAQQKYSNPEDLFSVEVVPSSLVPTVQDSENSEDSSTQKPRYTQAVITVEPDVEEEDFGKALGTMTTALSKGVFEGVDSFDSSVAGEMKFSALQAIVVSLIAIVAYIWFRFQRITFGLAAVVAVVHDVLAVLGIVAMVSYFSAQNNITFLGLEDFKINLPMIAAFLTIVGYSLNDTIVVFDRIREVRGKNPALTEDMIDRSLNQTLSRTLLTSLTTWFVVAILYGIGGSGIHGFAFCLVMGVIVGTYSSIYVASPVLLWLMNRQDANAKRPTPQKTETAAG